jgi:hydrogenase expression/formation protein HypC
MCLAVPGKIVRIVKEPTDVPMGRIGTVDFQGTTIDVNLDMTPDASKGDWVLVHAGFAINQLDEAEAQEVWGYLREIEADVPGKNEDDDISPKPTGF